MGGDMNFGLAFSFPFQDKDWFKKLAIPALVSLIPIVGQLFILGWSLEVTRRVIRHDPVPLPDMDLGENLSKGFLAWVIGLIYAIPLIVIIIPFSVLSAAAGNDVNSAGGYVFVSLCFSVLAFLYGLLMAFVLPAAYGNFVDKNQFGAAFNFSEVFGLLKSAPGAYLITIVGALLAGLLSSLGVILCVVGVLLTAVYAMAVAGHLYGQAYNEATKSSIYTPPATNPTP
jgi:hypothetical protein